MSLGAHGDIVSKLCRLSPPHGGPSLALHKPFLDDVPYDIKERLYLPLSLFNDGFLGVIVDLGRLKKQLKAI